MLFQPRGLKIKGPQHNHPLRVISPSVGIIPVPVADSAHGLFIWGGTGCTDPLSVPPNSTLEADQWVSTFHQKIRHWLLKRICWFPACSWMAGAAVFGPHSENSCPFLLRLSWKQKFTILPKGRKCYGTRLVVPTLASKLDVHVAFPFFQTYTTPTLGVDADAQRHVGWVHVLAQCWALRSALQMLRVLFRLQGALGVANMKTFSKAEGTDTIQEKAQMFRTFAGHWKNHDEWCYNWPKVHALFSISRKPRALNQKLRPYCAHLVFLYSCPHLIQSSQHSNRNCTSLFAL